MYEYLSLRVPAADHESLASQLTERSTDGWDVVSLVADGSDLIALLRQPVTADDAAPEAEDTEIVIPASTDDEGWAAASDTPTSDEPAAAPADAPAPVAEPDPVAEPAPAADPAPAATPAIPAGWYADPAGRYELRYWDGAQWTEHVSRAGQQYSDPPVA